MKRYCCYHHYFNLSLWIGDWSRTEIFQQGRRGKSYNSCDRQCCEIERAAKMFAIIETPNLWIKIIKEVKQKEPKIIVTKMGMENFVSIQELTNLITNRKKDTDKARVNWLKLRSLQYDRKQPFRIFAFNDANVQLRIYIRKRNTSFSKIEFEIFNFVPNHQSRLDCKMHCDSKINISCIYTHLNRIHPFHSK